MAYAAFLIASEEVIEAAYLAGFEPSSDDATEAQVLNEATEYLLTFNR